MDFDLDPDQSAILDGLRALLEKHAGAERAIELNDDPGYDAALDAALAEAGFAGLGSEVGGALEAVLGCEAVGEAAGLVPFAASVLLGPRLVDAPAPRLAVCVEGEGGPIRYAPVASHLLVVPAEADGEDRARWVALPPEAVTRVRSNYATAMGRVDPAAMAGGTPLEPGSGERARAWWRVAIAAEVAGLAGAALGQTVDYLTKREQFGRPIGSFQGVQHRLAQCAVRVEGTRWLAREAAFQGAPAQLAAAAGGYAADTAEQVFRETHQLSGAIGFTREHDLHAWSMRLPVLRFELGGAAAHHRALARARWTDTSA